MTNIEVGAILGEFARKTDSSILTQSNCVNIVMTKIRADSSHPFNVKLDSFKVPGATKDDAAQQLFERPELLSKKFYVVSLAGGRRAASPSTMLLSLEKVTPREVLNAIVATDGNSYWSLFVEDGQRYFSFGRRAKARDAN